MTRKTDPQLDFVRHFVSSATTGQFFSDLLRLHAARQALIPASLRSFDSRDTDESDARAA